jgi:diguanylate cyclase (GGDEF)-like protein/PAS domain S-box-containing protein
MVRESLNHALLDVSLDAVVGMDGEGLVVEFNPAAEQLFGYSREEAIGQRLATLIVPPDLRQAHEQGFRRYLATGESSVLGRRIRLPALRADGSTVSVELAIAQVEHEPPLFIGFIRDLTAAEAAEEELRAAETRYRSLVEQLPLVTYITSSSDRPATLYISPQVQELVGYPVERWLGADNTFYESILHPDDRARVTADFAGFRAAGKPFRCEYRLVHADGSTVWVIEQTTPIYADDGTHLYSQGFLLNVTERKHLEEQMLAQSRREAMTDALTGLGNRRQLSADLTAHLDELDPARPLMLTLFDLDGFKQYNDMFGHPAGDQLLERLTARLSALLAGRGTAYRMGGDEFCALWNLSDVGEASVMTIEAVAALSEHGESFSIGCSYGSVLLPNETTDSTEALRIADRRMYVRKGSGHPSAARQSSDVLQRALAESSSELSLHLGGVADLVCATAERLGVREEDMEAARQTGLLHDVGKFAIPDAILDKRGPLEESEWEFMKRHTVIGERIISAAPALAAVAKFVRSTHERYDGGGYPDGLAGDAIPLIARIVSVCDAYDAMVTNRAYRDACERSQAIAELRRCSGTQFDPDVVEALVGVLETTAHRDLTEAQHA